MTTRRSTRSNTARRLVLGALAGLVVTMAAAGLPARDAAAIYCDMPVEPGEHRSACHIGGYPWP